MKRVSLFDLFREPFDVLFEEDSNDTAGYWVVPILGTLHSFRYPINGSRNVFSGDGRIKAEAKARL